MSTTDFDYVIVGSGAGGGPLAANLAKTGFSVLLMEAGGDPCSVNDMGRWMYEVPIFHGLSTEYPECAWNYFVRHYSDDEQQKRDTKYVAEKDGVWYPRAGTLGGCTAHNAMITVLPQASDWNRIATITGDASWRAENMRHYFTRLENCRYIANPDSPKGQIEGVLSSIRELLKGDKDWRDWSHGHGFNGWLPTSEADPTLVLHDPEIVSTLLDAVKEAILARIGNPLVRFDTRFDPNDSRNATESPEGLAFTPLAVDKGRRNGPREYLLRTQKSFPDKLTILKNALAMRVIFEGTQAVGVEYREGPHLYKADPQAVENPAAASRREVRVRREVILAAGAFNSPQLLKLSGIGPCAELSAFGIPVIVDLPGVGENLQDRYEIGVVSEFTRNFKLLNNATFAPPSPDPDAYFKEWEAGRGIYASNGALIGIIKRSTPDKQEPDLYIFGLPGFFRGYKPGYSKEFERFHNRFTWAILKARTNNTGGRVTLRSANAWDMPKIEFHYFSEGNDKRGEDLEAVVEGVEFVRDMNRRLQNVGLIANELLPGSDYQTKEAIREFIQNEAWGHHASCSARIGADNDRMAVLDSRFRVLGTQGLRVVDASVFPRIPGYFIVSAVYMISEKATDVIAEDAEQQSPISRTQEAANAPSPSGPSIKG
ncbi:MAG: GMC family oxidoreductase [Acidobacteriaceae bacterium]|nr:GMC family oxidoreductase [Acidobacteriaceae bacterium]MBV9779880.1 GMC family oxidoreductase [Acidobacteriaceae bacterium]